jgi:hypothetical protein
VPFERLYDLEVRDKGKVDFGRFPDFFAKFVEHCVLEIDPSGT